MVASLPASSLPWIAGVPHLPECAGARKAAFALARTARVPKPILSILPIFCLVATPTLADVSRRDAIEAQTASALASADYAQRHCPSLRIGWQRVEQNLKSIKGTIEGLRRTESYAEQVTALQSVEKQHGRAMVCTVLPSAHGGYGRGVILH
jgi:hypothetical protein